MGIGHMAESFVLPIMTAAPASVLAEPVVEGGEDPPSDFSIEEAAVDALLIDAAAVDVPAAAPPPDPLQMLIEDLSGITGALRPAPPPDAAEAGAVLTDGKPVLSEAGPRIALAMPVDAAPANPAPAGPAPAPQIQADPLAPLFDSLPADPAPPPGPAPAAREDRVEVALAPEELGRIRMVMTAPAPPPDAAEAGAVLTDGKPVLSDAGPRIALAVPVDAAPANPAPAGPAPADAAPVGPLAADPAPAPQVQADPLAPLFDSLPADPAPPPGPAPVAREAAPAPAVLPPSRIPVPHVARQIVEAVVTAREDRVEVALAPEELGRIRMVMTGPDHSPHVMVWAERPEVLDQLRRNTAILQDCFGDAGMADASFEFQGEGGSGSEGRQPLPDSLRAGFDMAEPVSIPLAWTPMAVPARLDIRI